MTDSNWLMSIVVARQPHFPNQPKDVRNSGGMDCTLIEKEIT